MQGEESHKTQAVDVRHRVRSVTEEELQGLMSMAPALVSLTCTQCQLVVIQSLMIIKPMFIQLISSHSAAIKLILILSVT